MITLQDIKENEIIKVLLNLDDVEEEHFARVISTSESFMYVKYLLLTEKHYGGAAVYEEDTSTEVIEIECITEHYEGSKGYSDVTGLRKIPRTPYYIMTEEGEVLSGDESGSESEWETTSNEDEYQADDFCTDDEEQPSPPADHEDIDRAWNSWNPTSEGAKRFKERVDLIEQHVRCARDNQKFCAKTS